MTAPHTAGPAAPGSWSHRLRKLWEQIRRKCSKAYADFSLEKAAAIVTIVGIALAFWQFWAVEHDGRATATLNYVGKFGTSPVSNSFKTVYRTWDKFGYTIEHSNDPKTIAEKKIQFIVDHNLGWDSVVLGDFFDQFYVCLEKDICDLPLAISMLGRDIETVYVYTGRYLASQRAKHGGNAGCGLDALFSTVKEPLQYLRLAPDKRALQQKPEVKLAQSSCGFL